MDGPAATLLVGAGLVVVPSWIAWLAGRAHAVRHAVPGPRCSCGHGYGTHEDELRCHAADTRRRNGVQELDPCPCRRYDGPEPLPKVWTLAAGGP